jgi:hypothetical protein
MQRKYYWLGRYARPEAVAEACVAAGVMSDSMVRPSVGWLILVSFVFCVF